MRDRYAGKTSRIPEAAERAWVWFWRLSRTRNGNGYQANRITYPDILALAGDRPSDWEIDAILAMDEILLGLWAGDETNNENSGQRLLSPELFDAIMG